MKTNLHRVRAALAITAETRRCGGLTRWSVGEDFWGNSFKNGFDVTTPYWFCGDKGFYQFRNDDACSRAVLGDDSERSEAYHQIRVIKELSHAHADDGWFDSQFSQAATSREDDFFVRVTETINQYGNDVCAEPLNFISENQNGSVSCHGICVPDHFLKRWQCGWTKAAQLECRRPRRHFAVRCTRKFGEFWNGWGGDCPQRNKPCRGALRAHFGRNTPSWQVKYSKRAIQELLCFRRRGLVTHPIQQERQRISSDGTNGLLCFIAFNLTSVRVVNSQPSGEFFAFVSRFVVVVEDGNQRHRDNDADQHRDGELASLQQHARIMEVLRD